jgi:hypothetical protein
MYSIARHALFGPAATEEVQPRPTLRREAQIFGQCPEPCDQIPGPTIQPPPQLTAAVAIPSDRFPGGLIIPGFTESCRMRRGV